MPYVIIEEYKTIQNNITSKDDVCIDFMLKGVCENTRKVCNYYHPSWDKEKYQFCISKLRGKPCKHELKCQFIHVSDRGVAYIPNNANKKHGKPKRKSSTKQSKVTSNKVTSRMRTMVKATSHVVTKPQRVTCWDTVNVTESSLTVKSAFNFINNKSLCGDKILSPIVPISSEFYLHSVPDNLYIGMHDTSCECRECVMIDKLLSE